MRIVLGFLFFCHGIQKLFGFFGGRRVPVASLLGAAGLIETILGALIILGLVTSIAAFVAAGEMAVAYFKAHAPRGTWPIENGGELAVALCFVFLYVAARGGGRFSIDSIRR
jgi:putative oxidoreductase